MGEMLLDTLESTAHTSLGTFIVFVVMIATTVYVSHLLKNSALTTDGSVALLFGLATGAGLCVYFEMMKGTKVPTHLVKFQYELYMDILLPPIIFFAGFSIKHKDFFANSVLLVLLGIVGTFISTAIIAAACTIVLPAVGLHEHDLALNSLALGAVFSSTDSVAALQVLNQDAMPRLYSLVFGEGVVNDATSVVLLRAVQKLRKVSQINAGNLTIMLINFTWLFLGSLLLGVGIGLVCSYIIKRSFFGRPCAHEREVSLLALLGFLSYLLAEQLSFSGIFAAFFCGLSMSHWAWHSLSAEAKVSSLYLFRTLAFLAETMMFLSAGLDLWTTSLWRKSLYEKRTMLTKSATISVFFSILVPLSRAVIVPPIVWLVNQYRSEAAKISFGEMASLWWSGSLRGAVTLALAVYHFTGGSGDGAEATTQNQLIMEGCMGAVVISTIVYGALTRGILGFFLIGSTDAEYSIILESDEIVRIPTTGSLMLDEPDSISGKIRTEWVKFDRSYIQPIFGGRAAVADYGSRRLGLDEALLEETLSGFDEPLGR